MNATSDKPTAAGAYAKIEAHEDICAVRYAGINTALNDLKEGQKSHARAAWVTAVSLIAWLGIQFLTPLINSQQGQRVIVQTGHQ